MSYEGQVVFYSDQQLTGDNLNRQNNFGEDGGIPMDLAILKFMHFVLETQVRNTYIYR